MSNELNQNELQNAAGGGNDVLRTGKPVLHLVRPGETLISIAKQYSTSDDVIFILNKEQIIKTAKEHGVYFSDEKNYKNYIYPNMVLRVK